MFNAKGQSLMLQKRRDIVYYFKSTEIIIRLKRKYSKKI